MPDGWTNAAAPDDVLAELHAASLAHVTSKERNDRERGNIGLLAAAAGAAIGLAGMGFALIVHLRTPLPPLPNYVLVHADTGVIDPPTEVKDAPRLFSRAVRETAIRQFLIACEGYIHQTWQRLDYHACMVMAAPDEQKRRAAEIGDRGTRYPPSVFGPTGYAMPSVFPSFVELGSIATATGTTWHYQVRYERIEQAGGRETRARYTADLALQFHPEVRMSAADRLINPSGLQVMSFSTVKEP